MDSGFGWIIDKFWSLHALSNVTIYCRFVSGWSIHFGWLVKVYRGWGFLDNLAQAWKMKQMNCHLCSSWWHVTNLLASNYTVFCSFIHSTILNSSKVKILVIHGKMQVVAVLDHDSWDAHANYLGLVHEYIFRKQERQQVIFFFEFILF